MKGSSMRDGYQNYNTELERKLLERARAHVTMKQGGIMKWTCANKPLLMSVIQVMLRLFRPHTTTLMFVIRDETSISIAIMKISNMQPKA